MRPGHGARGPRCAARAVPALRWPERADLEAEPAELDGFALPEPRWPLRWLASERAHFEVEICWPLEAAVRMMPWAILLALELCYVLCGNLLDASVTIDVTFNDDAIVDTTIEVIDQTKIDCSTDNIAETDSLVTGTLAFNCDQVEESVCRQNAVQMWHR